MVQRRSMPGICVLIAVLVISACTPETPASAPDALAVEREISATEVETLRQRVQDEEYVAVIAGFAVPDLDAAPDDEARAAAIERERTALLQRLDRQEIQYLKTYEYLPFVAMTVDAAGLETLIADQRIISLEEDTLATPELDDSVGLIRADYNHIAAYTGSGQTIAILDTGVDRFHPDLAGKVVAGACYSTNNASQNASSTCPGGATSATTIGSSGPCTGSDSCNHGTHVAAIAAGVAPNANIISIQVFSRINDQTFCSARNRTNPCVVTYDSDQIAALERIFVLRNTYNIAAVNMSLGGGRFFNAPTCDSANTARRNTIQQLRNAGILTVVSAGNSRFTDSMGAPGCLSNVISVAASDKADQIASYSNIANFTTLIAPGSAISAAIPGIGNPPPRAAFNGTSMAAPHVAGAVALLRQAQPNATVPQIINALANTGPFITDGRLADTPNNIPVGTVSKRRMDTFLALCQLISCDADDFRSIQAGQTLNGAISPASDVDTYYFFGQVGDRITLRLNRTSGNLNPFLELFSPNNIRVAFNANGGGGVNSLINGYTLPQNGRYVIRVRGITGTGNYQLSASRQTVPLNPTPRITRLSPTSATATPFGSDFWVAIYGEGFTPESQVRWNGLLRSKFYSSSNLIYIRVRGSDINLFPLPPRLALITVRNPTPGGGISNNYPFNITVPFLGESELVLPTSGTGIEVGLKQTFVISWTHPTDSWRTMQRMDLRLRDPDSGQVALWLRVVERPNDPDAPFPSSTFRLLDSSAGSVPSEDEFDAALEGVPGSGPDLAIPGLVTVHMDESAFAGAGMTAIMTPTVSFDPALVGVYNIEFEVDSETPLDEFGNLQKDDVLGTFHILPAGCSAAVSDVNISGLEMGFIGDTYNFSASVEPVTATIPLTYTWTPEPVSGQGTATASFSWEEAGEQVVGVSVENCGGFAAAATSVALSSMPDPDLTLSLEAPPLVTANEPFTYTIMVRNDGAASVNNLIVSAPIPIGATYLSGGSQVGDTVQWSLAELPGIGATASFTYTVQAMTDVSASGATASASDVPDVSAPGPVRTIVVAAQTDLSLTDDNILEVDGIRVAIPGGAVFADTTLALHVQEEPTQPLPLESSLLGPVVRFTPFQAGEPLDELQLFEQFTISFSIAELPDGAMLYSLTDNGWEGVDNCARDNTGLVCTLPAGTTLTEYALIEVSEVINDGFSLYLPLIQR